MSIVIRIAEKKDLLPVQRLVAKAGLARSGIEENIENFLVVENEKNEMIGTVGLEKFSNGDGLLRSLVIKTSSAPNIALEFLQITLALAKQKEIDRLYLLASHLSPLLEFFDFQVITKEEVPKIIKESRHFATYEEGKTKIMRCYLHEN